MKVFFCYLPSVDIIKPFVCRGFANKTRIFTFWAALLLRNFPEEITALRAFLSFEAHSIE